MGVSNIPDDNKRPGLKIASRNLFQMGETNPECKKDSEQINRHVPTFGSSRQISVKSRPTISFGVTSMNSNCLQSCMYKGVVDILVRRNELFTFKEACEILGHCNIHENLTLIEETIRKYGIVFIGFPECTEEDLFLAVYFFIEDMFGIQANIEYCKRDIEPGHPDIVDVIFDNIMTKKKIADKHRILEGSGISIETFFDVSSIIDSLHYDYDDDDDDSN